MARLCAVADGNNTSSSTWALIDSTTFRESESTSSTLTTSYTGATGTTPGAITIDAIGVRIAVRSGTTGTMSVELYNSTDGASVAGTEVTVNMSDVVAATTSSTSLHDGGWMLFKLASPVTLTAGKAYYVRAKTSSSSQVSLNRSATTNEYNQFLRTTTTQAPVAGDDRYVMGEWTGAGSMTTRTVTLNDTTSTDYGSGSTSVTTPALSISNGGEVIAGTSSSTAYTQKISGNIVVYSGGKFNAASSGTRMPTTSSFTLTLDCASNVDFGISVRTGGEFKWYGESKTRFTFLTSDEAASSTSIQVVSTSGWKNTDTLLFTATGTTTTHAETKNISSVDSATQVTLTAGLTNAHTGTGNVVGEVGNLNSNVKIVGTSSSVGTYVHFADSSSIVMDNVELQYYGSGSTHKSGLEVQHIVGAANSATITSCVFKDPSNGSSAITLQGNGGSANGSNITFTNCIVYVATTASTNAVILSGGSTGSPTFTYSNILVASNIGSGTGISLRTRTNLGGTVENLYVSGFSTGISITSSFSTVADVCTVSNVYIHSNTNGTTSTTGSERIFTNWNINRNSTGISTIFGKIIYVNSSFIGNSTLGVNINTNPLNLTFEGCTFSGETSFNQPSGISLGVYTTAQIVCNNCNFGTIVAHTSSDINASFSTGARLVLNSCTMASTTEITSTVYTGIDRTGYVSFIRKDNTDGAHSMYILQGIVTPDTSIYRTASPSVRITPKSATVEAETKLFPFSVPVNNGQTCTPTLYVRESVVGDGTDYNGNRIKLYVKANYNLGITSDTLLDTATGSSEGAFEALTGTTAAVTDDGVLEFYLTCDGTTGWINYDDFSATLA